MSYLLNNQQKLNDIIFANRNKEYGAYAIRSDYGNTVFKSLSLMLLGVVSVMSVAFYFSNKNNPEKNSTMIIHDSIYVIPVSLKKDDQKGPEQKTEPAAKKTDTKPLESTIIADNDSIVETPKTHTTSFVGITTTLTSEDGKGTVANNGSITAGGGGGSPDTTKKINEGFEVDSSPVFEGGLSALYSFVSRHLKYPNWASTEGKEGTVYVKFVVDENGKVGSLTLLNAAGYGMDDEALRVVSLIPKFKSPAKVKGQPVKVYYQMPIRFRFN